MQLKLINIDNFVFDDHGKALLKNSFTIHRFGYRNVDFYADFQLLVPWLQNLISADRSVYGQAFSLFPDNGLWNNVLNIKSSTITNRYYENYQVSKSFFDKGINFPDPTSAEDCAVMYGNNVFSSDDIILDVGSGEGAFLNYCGVLPFKELLGVEIRENLYALSLDNLRNNLFLHPQNKIAIYQGDVRERFDLISKATAFYVFNSMDQKLLKDLLFLIKESLRKNPRLIKFVYCNAEYRRTVSNQNWLKRLGSPLNRGQIYIWQSVD